MFLKWNLQIHSTENIYFFFLYSQFVVFRKRIRQPHCSGVKEAILGNVFTDLAPSWVKKLGFSQIQPSEKLQVRTLLIKMDCKSPRLKSKFQENGPRRMWLDFRQTLCWTVKLGLHLSKYFSRQEVPTIRVGLVSFLRVTGESPIPQNQTHPPPGEPFWAVKTQGSVLNPNNYSDD